MPIKIHLDQLKNQDVHLSGELPAAELDLAVGGPNDLIRSAEALHFSSMPPAPTTPYSSMAA